MVKLFRDLFSFLFRFFRKRIREVARRELAVPPHHVVRNDVREAPQRIQHRQRQAREKLEHVLHEGGQAECKYARVEGGRVMTKERR